jgi:hypothetical protein
MVAFLLFQFIKQQYRTAAGAVKEGWALQINGSAFAGTAHAPAPDAPARNISVIWCGYILLHCL